MLFNNEKLVLITYDPCRVVFIVKQFSISRNLILCCLLGYELKDTQLRGSSVNQEVLFDYVISRGFFFSGLAERKP